MTYKSLMVHLELAGDNGGVLNIAGELAERFGARVIGIAACQPIQVLFDEGINADSVFERDRAEMKAEMAAAENQFRTALAGRAKALEWRSSVTYGPLADFVADEARAADLVITGKDIGASLFDPSRRVNIGHLAMRAGRPLLLVPQGIRTLPLQHVFVGWKEGREARRVLADALPLLRAAQKNTLLAITSESQRQVAQAHLNDVEAWLEVHGVSASALAEVALGAETGYLHAALLERKCDLFVAGAYGHNRISEWAFGGVTQDVLLNPDFCVLISH